MQILSFTVTTKVMMSNPLASSTCKVFLSNSDSSLSVHAKTQDENKVFDNSYTSHNFACNSSKVHVGWNYMVALKKITTSTPLPPHPSRT